MHLPKKDRWVWRHWILGFTCTLCHQKYMHQKSYVHPMESNAVMCMINRVGPMIWPSEMGSTCMPSGCSCGGVGGPLDCRHLHRLPCQFWDTGISTVFSLEAALSVLGHWDLYCILIRGLWNLHCRARLMNWMINSPKSVGSITCMWRKQAVVRVVYFRCIDCRKYRWYLFLKISWHEFRKQWFTI